jgi:transcriptional regulator with XRE-family HTH domain
MNLDHHPADRIRWIIDEYYKGHPKRLADALGVAPATFTQILNKGSFPSWKIIVGILRLHPQVNPDWFLHGRSPQTRDHNSDHHRLHRKNIRLRQIIERLAQELDRD